MNARELLAFFRSRDAELSTADGKLKCRAPKGLLSPELLAQLEQHKDDLIELLSQTGGSTGAIPRRPAGDVPPLSFAQQRLWFMAQLDQRAGAAYAMPVGVRLKGALETAALQAALKRIVARHEALRTTFTLVDGSPVQVIAPPGVEFAMSHVDLSVHIAPQAQLERLAAEEASAPFDLAHGPLIRGRLVRLADDDHVLWVTMHHIVSDGWSMGVLIGELSALYVAFAKGEPDPLPALPIQYADYAVWQRRWITGDVLQRQLDFWRNHLSGAPALLELPTDRRRPPVQEYAGASLDFELDAELSADLRALSRHHGTTLFMTLLASWAVLLSRLSGQAEVVVGTPMANRTRAELEPLIGFFVNTLALRIDLSGNPSVAALLAQVRATALAAQAHQDVPFEQVVDALNPQRSMAHAPLCQAIFVMQNAPSGDLQLPGLTLEPVAMATSSATTDLWWSVSETDDRLLCTVVYASALFERSTIERWSRLWRTLLRAMVMDNAQSITRLPLLESAERDQLVHAWNDTAADFPAERCIHELFEAQVARTPAAPALVFGDTLLSYAELDTRANRLAHHLVALGVRPDSTVALALRRGPDMVVALLATLKAGSAYVPLDPDYPAERLAFMLDDARPRVVLTEAAVQAQLPASRALLTATVLELDDPGVWQHRPDSRLDPATLGLRASHLAYVIYTSGSTGTPKGVMVAHAGLCNLALAQIAGFGVTPDSRVLQFASFSFDACIWEVLMALASGAALHLPAPGVLAGQALLDELRSRRITHATLPPAVLVALPEGTLPELHTLVMAGEAASQALVQRWAAGRRLVNAYGPTEATVCASMQLCEPRLPGQPPIGLPIANARIYILDAHGVPVPVGVAGEIHIGGAGVARGYLNRPQLTAECFVPDPFATTAGARMYKTGDLGRWLIAPHGHGTIEFLGRNDHQVKVRGFRIELGEIEARLLHHPGVREAVVLAREESPSAQRLVAYVTGEDSLPPEALRTHLAAQLPEYMVPAAYVQLDALPLTPNGKLDRRALPAPEGEAFGTRSCEAPQGEMEATLAAIWTEVLGVEHVGRHDHFFELGGHSLLAVQLASRIRVRLGCEVPLAEFFAQPTLAGFALRVAAATASTLPTIVPASRAEPLPLSFAQQRLWFLARLDERASAAYLIPGGVRLLGALDVAALRAALDRVVARHEALRTRFAMLDGAAVQVVAEPEVGFALQQVDLRNHAEPEAELERHAGEEASAAFDLEHGPLIRGRLVCLAEHDHVLLVTMHHIVSDGWSMGVLINEFTALYAAFAQGRHDPLPALAIQYADYAVWQRRWITGDVLQRQLDFWRTHLSGAPALLELPSDRSRPPVQDFAGAAIGFELDADLSAALQALSRRHGTTLFMTLLASWAALLSRLSGQDEVVIGTPMANRTCAEVEPLIGFFVNTQALRINLSGTPSVAQLLAQVRATALAAQDHQDLPFEQVVEALNPPRSLAHSPVFQVMFGWQNTPEGALELPGLQLQPVGATANIAKFDLELSLHDAGERIAGIIGYATALFEASTIERHLAHWQTLLHAMVADDGARVPRLPLLSAPEHQQLVHDFNATAAAYAAEHCIHELFEEQVARTPAATALVFEDTSFTYAELNARANQLAHYLVALGVRPDARVAIAARRGPDMVVALLATLKAGGAYVPLDHSYPTERLGFMLHDSAPRVLLTDSGVRGMLGTLPHSMPVVELDAAVPSWEGLPDRNLAPAALGLTSSNLAYVIYTSGSTGTPKGVQVEHRALCHSTAARLAQYGAAGCMALVPSFAFDASVGALLWSLCSASTLVLPTADQAHDPRHLRDLVEQHRVQCWLSTPALYEALWSTDQPAGLATLHTVILGGETPQATLLAKHAQRHGGPTLHGEYGPTEATVWATVTQLQRHEPAAIGRPIANARIYILDACGQPVPVGVAGEIHIGGAGVARGYLDRPDVTAERFVPDPFAAPGTRMYRTGDLGRWRADGTIEFLGRTDHQVKIRGFRIELGEIEARLLELPGVRDAVVLAREDEPGDQRLVAYVTGEDALPPETLRAHLATQLPGYMLPAAYVQLDSLPLTPNGKIDRRSLPAPGEAAFGTREFEPPQGELETTLAAIWADLLGVERVGRQDHFFELGGHSLLAVQLSSRIRAALGLEVPLAELFAQPTLAGFALHVAAATASTLPAIVRASRGESLPLSFAQQRLWFLARLDERASAAYLIPGGVRLLGALDVAALRAALDRIVARHDALRTRFAMLDGAAVQVIAEPDVGFTLEMVHLAGPVEPEAELERITSVEAAAPFNLERGPLIRGRLVRLAEHDHALLVTMHHIVSDGWSMGVLVNEFSTLYATYAQGQPDTLPPLTIQYADYAAWQRRWVTGEVLQRQLEFWRHHLWGAPALLELPTDRPRPPAQDYAGASFGFELDAELAVRLKALSRRHGTTLFMTLLASWAALLSRLSGQDEVVIGTPMANRTRTELEPLIGFFVNTLALRIDLSGSPSVAELLAQVRATTLAAQDHQELPFEQVVEALNPPRSLTHSPVFQVMFAWQNAPEGNLELPGLQLQPLDTPLVTVKFDLSLSLHEAGELIVGSIQYARALFDRSTVESHIALWQTLMRAMVAGDKAIVPRLPLLSSQERHQLLHTWNATETPFPADRCIHTLFEAQAARTPDGTALVFEDSLLSYAELNARANRLAHRLISLGVRPDTRVAIALPRGLEVVVALLATLKAGGAYVPLDPDYPAERLAFMLDDSAPLVLLTEASVLGGLGALPLSLAVLELDAPSRDEGSLPSTNPVPAALGLNGSHLAYVIYTSGSTGTPKGVMVEHRSVVNLWAGLEAEIYVRHPEVKRVSLNASLAFDASVKQLIQLAAGRTIVVLPAAVRRDGAALLGAIAKQQIDLLDCTPSQLELMQLALQQHSLRAPATVLVGGDALGNALWHTLTQSSQTAYYNVYGPTECTVDTTVTRLAGDAGKPHIGRPIANARVYILDGHGAPVPVGIAGEIHIGGTGVSRGYFRRPDVTAECFLPDPFAAKPGSRMYRSGDLGRWRPDGTIEFLGRNDHQVKIRGLRIELGEIEARLREHPEVLDAAVLAREDSPGDKRLVAYVVGASLEPEALRAHLAAHLPGYMVPAAYMQLDALPLTRNGKLDRQALPVPHTDAFGTRAFEAPQGELEATLAALWSELLGVQRIGRRDDFFALSGHSLLAVQLSSRIRARLGAEVPLAELFAQPTLAGFARRVAAAHASTLPAIVPAARDGALPLSFAQQRLWFLAQLDERAGAAYAIPGGVRLIGALDTPALQAALARIVARHEALRTSFALVEGSPLQLIAAPDSDFALDQVDLSGQGDAEAELKRLAAEEASAPFDLAHGPMIRTRLVRLAEQDHALLVTMHHIVSDGWSMGPLINELSALYAAFSQGRPDPLPALPVQYADYAVWQRRWITGDVLQRQLDFWRAHLSGAPSLLALPSDRPRPAVQDYSGARLSFELDGKLTAELKALGRRHGTTLFMTLLAAWGALLARLSGQAEVIIGTPVANRHRAEVEPLIGFFVNMQALRIEVSGSPSVAQLLAQVRATALAAQDHQDIPFEQVVEALNPPRSLAHSPVFQVMFAWQNAPEGDLTLPGLQLQPLGAASDSVKFDLELSLQEDGEHIVGSLGYASALFDACTVERHLGHWRTLLRAMVADDAALVPRLPLLSGEEHHQLVHGWNATEADFPAERCIHELFEAQAARTPQACAVVFEDTALNYAELNARANRLAHHLITLGAGPDACVAIALPRGIDMVVALLATLKAGGAYVPLDPDYPAERLAFMLADSAPRVLLTQAAVRTALGVLPPSLAVHELDAPAQPWEALPHTNPKPATIGLQPSHLAYVIYTSGSTGQPKGAMNEHCAVVNRLHWMQQAYALGVADAVLQKTPFGFDVSVWEFFWPWLVGARLVLARPLGQRDPDYLLDLIEREQVTTLHFVPSMLSAFLARVPAGGAASLRRIVCSGEALPAPLVEAVHRQLPHARLYNLYGPTEAAVDVTADEPRPGEPVTIGRPIANTRIYLLDAHGEPVPVGVPGEIHIGGVPVGRGYLNRPELTAERFVPDPFAAEAGQPGARLYKTGDLGRWLIDDNGDGRLEFLGRNDQQVKVRGFRIELGEIEARLSQHPQVREAVVLAREDARGDRRLVAYVVGEAQPEALRTHLGASLPEYMVPAAYVQLDALPLTANGKLDRRALPAPENAAFAQRAYEPPHGEIETTLAALWGQLLGVESVGRHDDFFALGGHSLLAVQLIERMRSLGWQLEVRSLFTSPTLADLAATVGSHAAVPVPPNLIGPACERITPELLPLVALTQNEIDAVVASVPGGAANVQDIYPLAPLQEGILFHHLAATVGDAYLQSNLLSFDSRERLDRFVAALQSVVDRHDILRTAFIWQGLPEPVQMVWRRAPLPVEELGLDGPDVAGQLRARFDSSHIRLDVRQAPLLRAHVAHDAEHGRWLLCLLQHHLVDDRTSLELLVEEVQAHLAGQAHRLPPPLPFRTFIAQARLGLKREQHEAFFRQMLADVDEPTAPFGLLDAHGDGSGVREAHLPLDPGLARQLREHARRLGVSAASLFHLAWALMLARTSGRDDVVFGTVLFGRMQGGEGAHRVLGLFLNTLPLRLTLDGTSVEAAVRATHARLAHLLHHEHAPLTLAQRASGVPAPAPLFTALLNYRYASGSSVLAHDPAREEQAWDGIQMLHAQERTNYPLGLSVNDAGEAFSLDVQVDQRIDAQRVGGLMLQALQALAHALEHAPAGPVRALDVLPAAERHQLVHAWNATEAAFPAERCIHELFEDQVARTPEATALVFEDSTLSYAELNGRANRLAHHLSALGVRPDTRVAIALPRGIDMVVALLATLKAGGAYVPLDPDYPPERLAFMLADSAPRVLLTQAAVRATLGTLPPSLVVLALDAPARPWDGLPDTNPDAFALGLHPSHLAYVIYTSGSTGQPKGAMVAHAGLCNLALAQIAGFAVTPGSRVLQFASFSFDACISEVLMALCSGAALHLPAPGVLAGPALLDVLHSRRITHATLPPAVLMTLPEDALPELHTLVMAGEAASQALVQRWAAGRRLVNAYGPTEATVCATMQLCDVQRPDTPPIGQPIANTRIYILDARGAPVPVGVAGEIYIGGVQVARGYLNRPDLTAEHFLPDPFAAEAGQPGARLYKTGDLGRWVIDPHGDHGTIEFLGRRDQQVKIRGFRIEPGEIEARLLQHPKVQQAVVLARKDQPGDRRLTAYVVPPCSEAIELWPSVAEFFVYDDLLYHAMTHDQRRNDSYRVAMRRAVNGKVVLDVGTGKDAILARLCVEEGARKVYAIELLEASYLKARACIESLGLQDRIVLIHGDATQVELPELVDVCVSEIVGPIGGCEGAGVLLNSVRRLMKPDAVMIPERTRTRIAAVSLPDAFLEDPRFTETSAQYVDRIFEQRGYRFDFRLCLRGVDRGHLISDVGVFEDLDHRGPTENEFVRNERLQITRESRIDGFLIWLNLHTAHDEVIDILDHEYCWLPVYCPAFDPGVAVSRGDMVEFTVTATLCDNGVNPDYRVQGRLVRGNGQVVGFDHHLYHYKPVYKHTPFHRRVFGDDDRPRIGRFEPMRPTAVELAEHLKALLPEYMVPAAYVVLDALPLTANGKLDRRALPAPSDTAFGARSNEAPQGELECMLALIWSELLGVERIGRHDDFFALGGHSLLAVQLASRIRTRLGAEVSLAELFAQPTLASLALHVTTATVSTLPAIVPVSRAEPLPLSFAQQRLWFLMQLDERASAAYLIPGGVRLVGALDVPALHAALNRIVARHEALRTSFVSIDETPVQVFAAPEVGFALAQVDLSTHAQPEAELERFAELEAAAPFDLSQTPLIRGRLVRLAPQDHVLLVTMHHIVSDGWSMGVLVNEFSALYAAFAQGQPDPLPALAVQYADYAVWQRRWITGDVLQPQLDFWRDHLSGAPALLELPTDRPRPPVQDYSGASLSFELDGKLTAELKALGRRHGTTFFMTLLAAWGTLLARLSGQDEVVIGTPMANRHRAEVEPLIGFFVNTQALRIDVSGSPSVAQLLAQVRATALAAQDHQDIPFEQVVEALNPPRSLAHSPVFQVMFAWQNAPEGDLDLPGLQLQPLGAASDSVKFDLELSLQEDGAHIVGSLGYASALFDAGTVERHLGHWRTLLRAMVADDAARVPRLPLLSGDERDQLVHGWNATEADFPAERCIHELFEDQAARTPEACAVMFEDAVLSYAELNARANRLAHHLATLGVEPDTCVAIALPRGIDMVVALLATLKAGGAYVPLDPDYPAERLAFMLADSAPRVLLTESRVVSALGAQPPTLTVLELDAAARPWDPLPAINPTFAGLTPSHLAYVIYTSGSTGTPKGVMVEHAGLVRRIRGLIERYGFTSADRVLQFATFTFDASVEELFCTLCAGATLVMRTDPWIDSAAAFWSRCAQAALTVVDLPTRFLQQLVDSTASAIPPQLRLVIVGGEELPLSVQQRWREAHRCTLLNTYGPTETIVVATAQEVMPGKPSGASIGQPVPHTRLYIVDSHGEPVPLGVAGEIHIGGAGVARGYLHRPDLTAERFVPDPFAAEPGARMYKTGDLGRWLIDDNGCGTIEFLGRNDQQVKIRGFRIELGEIEARLLLHPEVRKAVVLAREDAPGDKRLVAYVVGENALEPEALRAHLGASLPEYMVPAAYVRLDALPLTPNGKLDRHALPAPEGDAFAQRAYEAPHGELETALAAIWRELLCIECVGRHDDFFALGGHSLLAVQLRSRMSEQLDCDLPLSELFTHPTISALANRVLKHLLSQLDPADARELLQAVRQG